MTYILLLIIISTILSYLIFKCIYRIIFKSKKSVSKFLVFLGSIGLIIFYYTPYSYYLEPSYWQFRNMCKLNELPNNEEKYNKILGYFDKKLGDIDDFRHVKKYGSIEMWLYIYYDDTYKTPSNFQEKIEMDNIALKTKNMQMSLHKIVDMHISPYWNTRRYVLEGNEGNMNFEFIEDELACGNLYQ
ncbi:hypothetical protein BOQ03_08545 [Campylobacter coli]|nr:hypothetical protein BOQ03_08545 [Campylobacter coli]